MDKYTFFTKLIGLFINLIIFSSCASIINKSYQEIPIISKPEKAKIIVNNQPMGETPCTVKISRGVQSVIKIEKKDYLPAKVELSKVINTEYGIFGNILCLLVIYSPIGIAIDWYTGALYDFIPDKLNVTLTPINNINFEKNLESELRGSSLVYERYEQREKVYAPNNNYNVNFWGNYYALVIGINNYKEWNKLKTAVNDARKIAKILENDFGFNVQLMINEEASRDKILDSINKYQKKLRAKDKFLIYYAGHGYFDKTARKGYWIPYDADKNSDTKWILSDSITTNIHRIAACDILLISDSCYSGTLTRSDLPDLSSQQIRINYLNDMLSKKSRVLISSGGNEPVEDDDGSGHSVFANSLIYAFNNFNNNIFTAQEIFSLEIKERVSGLSLQTPEYKAIQNSGHEGGDFVFRRKH